MVSDFTTFQNEADFNATNNLDNPTWQKKKIYDSSPYLIIPRSKFSIKIGQLRPSIYAWCKQKNEQFGDANAFDLTGYTVKFRMYDNMGVLTCLGDADITNAAFGEIVYNWKEFDIQTAGFFTGEFEFISSDNLSFKLPGNNNRFHIIVQQ